MDLETAGNRENLRRDAERQAAQQLERAKVRKILALDMHYLFSISLKRILRSVFFSSLLSNTILPRKRFDPASISVKNAC